VSGNLPDLTGGDDMNGFAGVCYLSGGFGKGIRFRNSWT